MDLIDGYPYWLIKNGLPYNYPKLEKNSAAGIVIIGAGISGALILYHLVNAGFDCLLIDKRTVGLGSSCASTSLLQYEIDVPLSKLSKKIGIDNAVAAYQLCSSAIDKLEAIAGNIGFKDFQRTKSLYVAANQKDASFLQTEAAIRKKAGFEISLFKKTEIRKEFGFTASALLMSEQAAQTDAYAFTHQLLQYAIRKGARVYDRTQAKIIKSKGEGFVIKTGDNVLINATRVVYATGYEASSHINKKLVQLKSTYVTCSEQLSVEQTRVLQGYLWWNTADPYLYIRLTSDNRIIVGGKDDGFADPVKRNKLLPGKAKQLVKEFKKIFPSIPFKTEFSWAGTFAETEDGLPYIGSYKNEKNKYYSLGFGGNGITFSLLGAEIITAMIKEEYNKNQVLFSFNRFKKSNNEKK